MNRREFIRNTTLIASAAAMAPSVLGADSGYPTVRVPEAKRKFKSVAVEKTMPRCGRSIGNKEMAWMFENCFPNTLDTTVDFGTFDGRPDTYVITGDIDAMWLRDSSAQVWPYLPLMKGIAPLQQLIAGVINRQTRCILKDPYANAFYKDDSKVSEWKSDNTEMKPGVHERKWEIDSLCYPIRLAYRYWKSIGDTAPFDDAWLKSDHAHLADLPRTAAQDRARPVPFHAPHGNRNRHRARARLRQSRQARRLDLSIFRPSDDATVFPFLVPSNFFAVVSLRQAAEMVETIKTGCRPGQTMPRAGR